MFKTIDRPASCEIRAVIKFLNARNVRPCEIYRQISETYGENAMSEGMVRKWVRMFNEGRENVHDEERSGRPSLITEELVRCIDEQVRSNRRFTISDLSMHFQNISRSLLHEIVTEHLHYKKLCARWVPKTLTDVQKRKRMGAALEFLQRYATEGNDFLKRIVTGDETWICYETPETKRQSLEWRHTGSPKPKKAKPPLSSRKIMCTVFWDWQGILLVDWMERGTTINSTAYCETLKKLRRAIQNKRRGLLTSGIVFVHDNARPHTARVTTTLLDSFRWEQFCHPPYSPDLAPSDFHLFSHLKKFLAGQHFASDDEIKVNVQNWFRSQAAEFYEAGMLQLVPRYDTCLNSHGEYVEK